MPALQKEPCAALAELDETLVRVGTNIDVELCTLRFPQRLSLRLHFAADARRPGVHPSIVGMLRGRETT